MMQLPIAPSKELMFSDSLPVVQISHFFHSHKGSLERSFLCTDDKLSSFLPDLKSTVSYILSGLEKTGEERRRGEGR